MPIEYQKFIRRADLKANPTKLYIFGDNLAQYGMGGQAREMRGELNAYGIPTKHDPATPFSDADYARVLWGWHHQFQFLTKKVMRGDTIVVPEDGIGTGLANLPVNAPMLYHRLVMLFAGLEMDATYANNN